jgi:hypothetical protein
MIFPSIAALALSAAALAASAEGFDLVDVTLRMRTQAMMGPLRAAVRKAHALGVTIAASTEGSYADDDMGACASRTTSRCCGNSVGFRRSSRSPPRRRTARA